MVELSEELEIDLDENKDKEEQKKNKVTNFLSALRMQGKRCITLFTERKATCYSCAWTDNV